MGFEQVDLRLRPRSPLLRPPRFSPSSLSTSSFPGSFSASPFWSVLGFNRSAWYGFTVPDRAGCWDRDRRSRFGAHGWLTARQGRSTWWPGSRDRGGPGPDAGPRDAAAFESTPARPQRQTHGKPASSTTRSRVGGRQRFHLAEEARARGIEPDRAGARNRPRAARPQGGRRRSRRARDGRRGRCSEAVVAMVAAEQGLLCLPFRPGCAMIRARSGGRPRRRGRALDAFATVGSAGSTSPKSTAGCSSTNSRLGSTPRPSSVRVTGRRS